MATLSVGESKWRMLRRVLKSRQFTYDKCRNQTRLDQANFDWLLEKGFVVEVAPGKYSLTDKGRETADLGFYEI